MSAGNPNLVKHTGRVVGIYPGGVDVAIVSSSACFSCAAKKACGMTESSEKIISVRTPQWAQYGIGSDVVVSMKQSMGTRAVVYVYVLPLVFVFSGLIALIEAGISEIISGFIALGLLGIYYLVLYFLREKIEKQFDFQIDKPDNNQP